jgi:hypothetical protein
MKPETKFYAKVKKNITSISWIRLENLKLRMPLSTFQNFMGEKKSGTWYPEA